MNVSIKNNTKPVKAAVRRLLDKVRVKVLEKTKDNSPVKSKKGQEHFRLWKMLSRCLLNGFPILSIKKYNNILQQLKKDVESVSKKLDTKISLDTIPAELKRFVKI